MFNFYSKFIWAVYFPIYLSFVFNSFIFFLSFIHRSFIISLIRPFTHSFIVHSLASASICSFALFSLRSALPLLVFLWIQCIFPFFKIVCVPFVTSVCSSFPFCEDAPSPPHVTTPFAPFDTKCVPSCGRCDFASSPDDVDVLLMNPAPHTVRLTDICPSIR